MNYINKIELYIDLLLKDKKLNIDLFPKNDKLPFEVAKRTKRSKDLEEALAEAKEMREHPEKYKTFSSVKELMEDLEE